MEYQKIWVEQCQATEGIKERYGIEKAMGYLIGEKLVNLVQESDQDPLWAPELPFFIDEIKGLFSTPEIREYLETITRTGTMGHACTDEEFEIFREAGAIDDDPVRGAEDMLIVARIKEMLTN
ncbi:MAG: hypothetical protein M3Y08_18975 [Fibrobacterota bacterium]|nr:hypothetical protein [Fibrobacterota bacterium]